jgi:hypothetical protein
MLVAHRMAGQSAFERHYAGVNAPTQPDARRSSASSLQLGSVAFEGQPDANGQRTMRLSGEGYSEIILRTAQI